MTPAERRALLRRHHPDLGGDPDEFVRLLAALDEAERAPGAATTTVRTHRARRAGWRRRPRLVVRRVSTALPRRLPGTRRYGRL